MQPGRRRLPGVLWCVHYARGLRDIYADRNSTLTANTMIFAMLRCEFLGDLPLPGVDVTLVKILARLTGAASAGKISIQHRAPERNRRACATQLVFLPRRSSSWRLNLIPGYWVPSRRLQRRRPALA